MGGIFINVDFYYVLMDWRNVVYSLIIVLLYVPTVFLGANVFFPDYDGYFQEKGNCYAARPIAEDIDSEEQKLMDECWEEQNAERQAWEDEKDEYDSWKYIFIIGVNIVALILLVVLGLMQSVKIGLFAGVAVSSFAATIGYFESKSLVGFVLVVIVLIGTILIMQKRLIEKKK